MIKVSGDENKLVYSGKQHDRIYQLEGSAIQTIPQAAPIAAARGQQGRTRSPEANSSTPPSAWPATNRKGRASRQAFPPLAKSDYLNADPKRAISNVLHGLTGKVTVNGETYESIMPQLGLG